MPKDIPVLVHTRTDGEVHGRDEEYGIYVMIDLELDGTDYYTVRAYKPTHWKHLDKPPTIK